MSFIYYLNIAINQKNYALKYGITMRKYKDINEAIKDANETIHEYMEEDLDTNIIEEIFNCNSDEEFSKYYDLDFSILCINENKPIFNTKEEMHRLIYNNYISTHNIFHSILNVLDCILYLDFKGNVKYTYWEDMNNITDSTNYEVDLNNLISDNYKYNTGDIVEYCDSVCIILNHGPNINPKDLLLNNIDIYHYYTMYGIYDNEFVYYNGEGLDKYIRDCEIFKVPKDKEYIIPFIKQLPKIANSSLNNNGSINEDLINRKYHYWLATGEINYDLK